MRAGDEPGDDAFDPAGKLMATVDRWLVPIGWMFGIVFVGLGLGLSPAFTEGGDGGLLALGVALLALSRAAAAGIDARRQGRAGPVTTPRAPAAIPSGRPSRRPGGRPGGPRRPRPPGPSGA